MNKRHFLTAAGFAGLLPAMRAGATPSGLMPPHAAGTGPTLLTVTGAIGKSNRGPLDPALDQMLAKHGVEFTHAWTFNAAALQRLPSVTIYPTLEYDAKMHTLQGPLLETVLQAAGVAPGASVMLGLRAVDGYNVALTLADVRN